MLYLILSKGCVPVVWLLLQFTTFHFALKTPNQTHRKLLLPFIVYFSWLSFTAARIYNLVPGLANLWAHGILLNLTHIISLFLIEKLPSPGPGTPLNTSIRATYGIWSNPQLLETKSIRDKSEFPRDDEKGLSKTAFLFIHLSKIPVYYFIDQHVVPAFYSETIMDLTTSDVADPALLTRLGDVTAREVMIRTYTATWWIWKSVVLLDGANALLASIGILVGQDHPSDWPTLFGSPVDACGLRKFWSRFWHRLAVRPYKNYARLAFRGLGLKPGTPASKTVIAFTIFLLSGVSHAAASWLTGSRDWLDVQWFLLNFLGCSAEMLVLSTVRFLAARAGCTRDLRTVEKSWFGYALGYAWVFAFFFWSVPLLAWPRQYAELARMERWMSILSKMTIVPPDE